jgi:hypothetical protein
MEHDNRRAEPGAALSSPAGRTAEPAVGKSTRVQLASTGAPTAHAAADSPLTSTQNLGASGELQHHFGTSYVAGPKGTALKIDISARMFGRNDHGSAELVASSTSVNGGKPQGNVTYRYENHFFTLGLTGEGHLKIDKPIFTAGAGDRLKWTIHEVSEGPKLTINLTGTYTTKEKNGRTTSVGLGLTMDITAIKKPPRGVPEDPVPVAIPLKLLVPTLAEDAGESLLPVILEGLAVAALA